VRRLRVLEGLGVVVDLGVLLHPHLLGLLAAPRLPVLGNRPLGVHANLRRLDVLGDALVVLLPLGGERARFDFGLGGVVRLGLVRVDLLEPLLVRVAAVVRRALLRLRRDIALQAFELALERGLLGFERLDALGALLALGEQPGRAALFFLQPVSRSSTVAPGLSSSRSTSLAGSADVSSLNGTAVALS
jgi:hypothetical protein